MLGYYFYSSLNVKQTGSEDRYHYTSPKTEDLYNERKFNTGIKKTRTPRLNERKDSDFKKVIVSNISEDRQNRIWIQTRSDGSNGEYHGLWLYSSGVYSQNKQIPTPKYGGSEFLFQDNENNIWLGTNLNGLWELPADQSSFIQNEQIPHKFISNIFQDAQKNIWIGTPNDGVWEKRNKKNKFILRSEIPRYAVPRVIFQDKNTDLWFCSIRNGVYKYISKADKFSHFGSIPDNADASLILEDDDNNIWIGTNNNGLFEQVAGKNGFTQNSDIQKDDSISKILSDNSGNIWIASNHGLWEKRSGDSNFVQMLSVYVTQFFIDDKKNIWLGTLNKGLWQKPAGYANFNHCLCAPTTGTINKIFEDADNNMLFGYFRNGLWTKGSDDDKINLSQALPANATINIIFEDKNKFIWINNGNNGGVLQLLSLYNLENSSLEITKSTSWLLWLVIGLIGFVVLSGMIIKLIFKKLNHSIDLDKTSKLNSQNLKLMISKPT